MSFSIRDLTDYDDLRGCVSIQERTWGPNFSELVPAAILWIATKTGGVVAGAFDGNGAMIGFLFGISGFREGRPIHWSDMLAVVPEARGSGAGQALKAHQRRTLLERGIQDVHWTFDPLESRNAHINLGRLGAVSREYIRDCYGASDSPLHVGLPTDRLVIWWPLASERVRRRMDNNERPGPRPDAVTINEADHEPRLDMDAPLLRLRIPSDIQTLKAGDPELALRWRYTVRTALEFYLGRGYTVLELLRENEQYSGYVLGRADAATAALS